MLKFLPIAPPTIAPAYCEKIYTIAIMGVILFPLLMRREVVMAGLQCPPVSCPAKLITKNRAIDSKAEWPGLRIGV